MENAQMGWHSFRGTQAGLSCGCDGVLHHCWLLRGSFISQGRHCCRVGGIS